MIGTPVAQARTARAMHSWPTALRAMEGADEVFDELGPKDGVGLIASE